MTLGMGKWRKMGRSAGLTAVIVVFFLSACGSDSETEDESFQRCDSSVPGTPWVPAVPGSSLSHHDDSVEIVRSTHTATVPILGLGQGANCSAAGSSTCPDTVNRIVELTFTVSDLGDNGAISLMAEPYGYPTDLAGSAWPILVSLEAPDAKEWVGFDLSGGSSCSNQGFFDCSGGSCSPNASCSSGTAGAYADWSHWRQNNIPAFGYASTNTFPTCNWTGGDPTCNFAEGGEFFVGGRLPTGTYKARYVLLASSYSKLSSGYTAGIRLTVLRKKDTAPSNGAFDLNVIIVGRKNVDASRTAKGKANLNALFEHVSNHFGNATEGAGVKVGRVSSYEICGNSYASVDFTEVGDLLRGGSALVEPASEGRAINVFLVSSILFDDANLTILGASGSIGGPLINGTGSSGVVFSTFDRMSTFNQDCTSSVCLIDDQEVDFVEMGNTVSHEIGHYLGLNHLSEMNGARGDPIPDTPRCDHNGASSPLVTHQSCLKVGSVCKSECDGAGGWNGTTQFCPAVSSCEFNHVMWYTVKKYNSTTGEGDGHKFSPQSSTVINYNPFVQ